VNEESKEVLIACLKITISKNNVGILSSEFERKFLNMGAAVAAIFFPVTVPPVNEMAVISG